MLRREGAKMALPFRSPDVLLTTEEMARADAAAIESGVSGETLMENAGTAVAREIALRWSARPTVVLCGPGNNGGDGYVVARLLARMGWPVTVASSVPPDRMKDDAARHAALWLGATAPLAPQVLDGKALVVDALFGAGLVRDLEGTLRATLEAAQARGMTLVSVDVPSGVDGNSGAVLGFAPQCHLTVTFFRKKPGHLLLPGRVLAGETVVAGIGIPDSVLDGIAPCLWRNGPALWPVPRPMLADHKYARGHAVILGGARMTGAARLAARAALRGGAGLVTIAAPDEAFAIYAAGEPGEPGVLVEHRNGAEQFEAAIADPRRNAVLIGPGAGVGMNTRAAAIAALRAKKNVVLDADAITAFADDPETLFARIASPCLLTPHEGEFARLFHASGDKVARARVAAAQSGAAVLLKGADTVIAAPDGRAVINANAPADLATAGAGDVLAGFALALMAQGMGAFEAGAAAAWLHGEAGAVAGPGLIAEDLPEALPGVYRRMFSTGIQ
jgi:ADP-dependent NAD(P)H-hydrate dehydratase / NAD(P)H-hydrate epimerase